LSLTVRARKLAITSSVGCGSARPKSWLATLQPSIVAAYTATGLFSAFRIERRRR